jgi:hypothetical protein
MQRLVSISGRLQTRLTKILFMPFKCWRYLDRKNLPHPDPRRHCRNSANRPAGIPLLSITFVESKVNLRGGEMHGRLPTWIHSY